MLFDVLLFVLASPILLIKSISRAVKRYRFLRISYASSIRCACGQQIQLLGMWRCSCGFTYRGHVLRVCANPNCRVLPAMVRCFSCGTTELLPRP